MNVTELWDVLSASTFDVWLDASDELLAQGYVWEYSAADDCYRLLDLACSGYFA